MDHRRGRAAARLSSGVRPVQKQMPVNKRETKLVFALSSPRPGVWFSPQTPCWLERQHSVSGFGLFAKSGFRLRTHFKQEVIGGKPRLVPV